ncbi:MAG: DUF479 domain-containing protein [Bacteroidia bacterium]|nr:DUF479 domain-containing protein [Bacteroidia bacterium]
MNYLAHLALSGNNEETMIGNYMGDSLRGIDIHTFSTGIQNGIKLHRFIDDFTDHHPVFISAKKYFTKKFDKYSGTLVDVCFDHFLAKNFSHFYSEDLKNFAQRNYAEIGKNYSILPDKAKGFYNYMTEHNILYGYSEKENIKKVLQGLTYRIKRKVLLYEGYEIFIDKYNDLEKLFLEFYPLLKTGSEKFCEETGIKI